VVIIIINDKTIELPPSLFAIYLYYLTRRTSGCKENNLPVCGDCTACFEPLFQTTQTTKKLVQLYKKIYGEDSEHYQNLKSKLLERKSSTYDMYLQKISKINRQIRENLDEPAEPFLISSEGKYAFKVYGIRLDKNRINILHNGKQI